MVGVGGIIAKEALETRGEGRRAGWAGDVLLFRNGEQEGGGVGSLSVGSARLLGRKGALRGRRARASLRLAEEMYGSAAAGARKIAGGGRVKRKGERLEKRPFPPALGVCGTT